MTRVVDVLDIQAPQWTVWKALVDPSHMSKFYPAIVSTETEPPGPLRTGSVSRIIGRVGDFRMETPIKFIRVEPERLFVGVGLPGGIFSSYYQTII
ncbi:MAG: SRPBCC family protein, partial [Nitrososphaerales archaeon]